MTTPSPFDSVADRVELLLAKYEELLCAHHLLHAQLRDAIHERDSLQVHLQAAHAKINTLAAQMPTDQWEQSVP